MSWWLFIIFFPGHTIATGFNSGFGLSLKGLLLRIALQITILLTGYIVLRMAPDRRTSISIYGERTMNVYLLHSLVVLPFAYVVFPPFGEATVLQKMLMIVIPTSICLLFFTKPVDRLMKIIWNSSDISCDGKKNCRK